MEPILLYFIMDYMISSILLVEVVVRRQGRAGLCSKHLLVVGRYLIIETEDHQPTRYHMVDIGCGCFEQLRQATIMIMTPAASLPMLEYTNIVSYSIYNPVLYTMASW